MKTVSIIGNFGGKSDQLSGQIVKTKIIADEIERQCGKENIFRFDTYGGFKTLIESIRIVCSSFSKGDNVIIMPAQNGLRVFGPLCAIWKNIYRETKLHYIVIGGWLPYFLQNRHYLSAQLKRFDYIYVETSSMKTALEAIGFNNVVIMPNCKNLHILKEEELVYSTSEPLKLCTFSRVMREKGIEDAINAVTIINRNYGRTVYTLDIYGQIDPNQKDWFEELEKSFPDFIHYNGIIPYEKSVETIKRYFALLFPTHFYTEGIPGTVLDAFAAGVPVIASKWESFQDLIEDGVTGIGYDYSDMEGLINTLELIAENPETLNPMRINCLLNAKKYTPERVIDILTGGG